VYPRALRSRSKTCLDVQGCIYFIFAIIGDWLMKDVMEILRAKEQELSKVKRQVEALRIAAPLLDGEKDTSPSSSAKIEDSPLHL
jgi:hypothetical protein